MVEGIDCIAIRNGIAHIRETDKEVQSLTDHLCETAFYSRDFADQANMGSVAELAGWIHDIGKNTELFTRYILSSAGILNYGDADYLDYKKLKGRIDHSIHGANLVTKRIMINNVVDAFLSQLLALCSLSHHGGLIDCLTPDGIDNYARRLSKDLDGNAYPNLDKRAKEEIDRLLEDPRLNIEISSMLNLAQKTFKTTEVYFILGMAVKFVLSCVIDADRISTADFFYPSNVAIRNNGRYLSWKELAKRLECELQNYQVENNIDKLRKEISDQCFKYSSKPPGLYQLTVPTGGGKTLSSLRFAINHADHNNMKRIIYVIPYTSIIDQNAQRARSIFEKDTSDCNCVILEHHSNLTPDEETEETELLSENWDAPIVFTTMVQFLETLFADGTRHIRRMHNLANSVIVFDEIQTLPIKCVYMFNAAVSFLTTCCNSTVVLCTATQPLLNDLPGRRGQDLSLKITPEQHIISNSKELYDKMKRVEVIDKTKSGGWTSSEVASLIRSEIINQNSILIVVNTKASAAALYEELDREEANSCLFYLSTNMCPAHRMDVLDRIKNNLKENKKTICISTQLIEAGVDIDFNMVIRYLAGLDSIAQAAGRCNRNGNMPYPGRVYIINPDKEDLGHLEDIRIGSDKARRILEEFKRNPYRFDKDILGIESMNQYYRYYFYEQEGKMPYPQKNGSTLYELLSINANSLEEYKRANNGVRPKMLLNQSFKTASKAFKVIDTATRGVIVPYGKGKEIIGQLCSEKDLGLVNQLLRQAQRYSINLFEFTFNNLFNTEAIHETQKGMGIFYLDEEFYDECCGLSGGKMQTLMC